MKNSELYKLAFQCLISDSNSGFDSIFINKIASDEEILLKFIHLCSNHLIITALFKRLKEKKLTEYLSTDIREHLENLFQLNIQRNRQILDQIDEISVHLKKAGIEPVFLKGTANLLDNLYTDFADRMIGDIDFLVSEKDYIKTAEIIKKIGYQQDGAKIIVELNSLPHYPRLFRHDVPADIEIHRSPVLERYNKKFNSNIIFDQKKTIPAYQNCFVTCDAHKLIHTFIHSQLSNKGYSHRIVSLRDLYDFYLISKRIDVDSILPEFEKRKKADLFIKLVKYMSKPETDECEDKLRKIEKNIRLFNWFLNHPKYHRLYIYIIKLIDIFIERPSLKIWNALLYKESRKGLIIRLKNPEWFKSTFNELKSFLKYRITCL